MRLPALRHYKIALLAEGGKENECRGKTAQTGKVRILQSLHRREGGEHYLRRGRGINRLYEVPRAGKRDAI